MRARLGDPEQIAAHDPSEYYLRIDFIFETSIETERYAWLNKIIAVATGRREADGIAYGVHEIL